jgi:hypothetical protein
MKVMRSSTLLGFALAAAAPIMLPAGAFSQASKTVIALRSSINAEVGTPTSVCGLAAP